MAHSRESLEDKNAERNVNSGETQPKVPENRTLIRTWARSHLCNIVANNLASVGP